MPPRLQHLETNFSLPRLGSLRWAATADEKPGLDSPKEPKLIPAPATAATTHTHTHTHALKGDLARALKTESGQQADTPNITDVWAL